MDIKIVIEHMKRAQKAAEICALDETQCDELKEAASELLKVLSLSDEKERRNIPVIDKYWNKVEDNWMYG